MDKFQAFQAFWASFGVQALDENSVPTGSDAPAFPYITYNLSYDVFGSPVSGSADIWTRSKFWNEALDLFELIQNRIKSGTYIHFDGGAIRLWFGSPMMNRLGDPDDNFIKRITMNINAEFISADDF